MINFSIFRSLARLKCVRGAARRASKRRFQLILLKLSHYHDDGYVIRWWPTMISSNSLAAIYGLAIDAAHRQVLGSDVEIDIDTIDEPNTGVDNPKLIRRFRKHGNFGLLALVGMQSNRLTSRGRFAPPASRWRWAGFTCPAAWRCSTARRSIRPCA